MVTSPFPPGWYTCPRGLRYYVMTPAEFREAIQQWNAKHARENEKLAIALHQFREGLDERPLVGPGRSPLRRVQLEIF